MKKISSRTTALVFVVACLLSGQPSWGAGIHKAEQIPRAVEELQSCIQAEHQLEVVAMVDTSGSLLQSDPNHSRVAALQEIIGQLSGLSESDKIGVEFSMVGFSTGITVNTPWVVMNSSTSKTLTSEAGTFANLAAGNTNFPLAISTATQKIQQEASALGNPSVCRAVLWITDGGIDLSGSSLDSSGTLTHQSQVALMCAPNGFADELATNRILTLAVGLATAGGMAPQSAQELRSYVLGEPNEYGSCGTHVSAATGAFFLAANAPLLLFQLSSALNPAIPSNPNSVSECTVLSACRPSSSFWIGSGVSGFTLLAESENPSGQPRLVVTTPSGLRVLAPNLGTQLIDGVQVRVQSSSLTPGWLYVSGFVQSAPLATGTWGVSFLAPHAQLSSPVYLGLSLQSTDELRILRPTAIVRNGKATRGQIGLVDGQTGLPVKGFSTVGVTATVGPLSGLGSGASQSIQISPSLGETHPFFFAPALPFNEVQISLKGYLEVGPNRELIALRSFQTLSTPLPADYPTVSIFPSKMKTLLPSSSSSARVVIRAGAVAGCYYLSSVSDQPSSGLGVKQAITPSQPTSPSTCLQVPAEQTRFFKIITKMTQQSSGTASVGITVMVQGRTPGQFAPVSKTYLINAIKPLNVGKSIAILSILILLGIALFVVITRVINNWLGRFQPAPQDLRIKTFQVAVVEGVDEFTNSLQDISPAKLEPLTVSDLNAGGEARLTRELRHGNLHLYAGSPHGGLGWFKSLDTGNTGYIEDISGAPFMTGGLSTPVSAMASGNRELFPGDAQRSLMLASLWVFSLREIQIGDEDNLGFGGSRMNGVAGEITVFLENGNSASLLPTLLRNALLGISGNLERIITNPDLNIGLNSNSSGIDDYTHQSNTDEPDLI